MDCHADREAQGTSGRRDDLKDSSAPSRQVPLDLARGCAVIGMIYMHLVPAEGATTSTAAVWTGLARLLDGKSAALFCILAGMSWSLQAQHASRSPRFKGYIARRSLSLAVAGLLLHLRIWPTEILIPLALMMPISLAICPLRSNRGPQAIALTIMLLVVAAPLLTARFGGYAALDWNEEGGHVADHALGWVTLRYLLFDGNYPLIPWLCFPLVGMLLVLQGKSRESAKRMFIGACGVAVCSNWMAVWAAAHAEALGRLAPHLASTWVPTSIPFLLETGGSAIAVIMGLLWWQSTRPMPRALLPLASLGRASLTHYLLHICVVIVALRRIFPEEEWPVTTGLLAFVIYVACAIPLSALWFRRFPRGPFESVWATLSGSRQ
jgi:uncharacterized protein